MRTTYNYQHPPIFLDVTIDASTFVDNRAQGSWPPAYIEGSVWVTVQDGVRICLFDSEDNEENLFNYLSYLHRTLEKVQKSRTSWQNFKAGEAGKILASLTSGSDAEGCSVVLEDLVGANLNQRLNSESEHRYALFVYSIDGNKFIELAKLVDRDDGSVSLLSAQAIPVPLENISVSILAVIKEIEGRTSGSGLAM